MSGIPDAGKVLRNIQGLDGRQPVPLNGSKRERAIKTSPLAQRLQNGRTVRDLHPGLDVLDLQGVGPHALGGRKRTGRRGRHRRRVQHENLRGQKSSAAPPADGFPAPHREGGFQLELLTKPKMLIKQPHPEWMNIVISCSCNLRNAPCFFLPGMILGERRGAACTCHLPTVGRRLLQLKNDTQKKAIFVTLRGSR